MTATGENDRPTGKGWRITVADATGCVRLPCGGRTSDLDAWAQQAARAVCGEHAYLGEEAAVADGLRQAVRDLRGSDPAPQTALSVWPTPSAGEVARISLVLVPPELVDVGEIDLVTLEALLATSSDASYRPPVAEPRTLDAGPAVRVRHDFVQDIDPETGTGTILQSLTYGISPPEISGGLVFQTLWRQPAYADDLCELTDLLAETIRVTPPETE